MKQLLFIAILSGCSFQAFDQLNESLLIDSINLDSLKRTLPALKDSARVDIFNEIALRTGYISNINRKDSVNYYRSIAYDEAQRIGYKSGIAMGLIFLAGNDAYMNRPLQAEDTKTKSIRKAIQMAEEDNNNEVLGHGYFTLGDMPSIRNDFEKHTGYYKKSVDCFLKAGDTLLAAEIVNWLVQDYAERGEYEQAFDYGKLAVDLSKKARTKNISLSWQEFLVQFSLSSMYDLSTTAADYEGAMKVLQEMDLFGKLHKGSEWDITGFTADLYCKMGKYDSALFYMNRWISYYEKTNASAATFGKGHSAIIWRILGQIYLDSTKEYDKAISIFKNWSDTLMKYAPGNNIATTDFFISIGQAYDGKKEYPRALQYAKKGLVQANENNQRPVMMKAYKTLSDIYHHMNSNDSAYEYLQKYNIIKDSIQTRQFLLRIYNSNKAVKDEKNFAQLGFLIKDNKIKQQQLQEEATIKKFLFALLLALVAAGIFVYLNLTLKRKNDKLRNSRQQAELNERAIRLEMQALRSQMNPHFIFNCLSSINCFILENQTELASDYLTRFSRLIRMVLTNSEKPLITLEEELKMLRLYLDMERLRFQNSFDYDITYTNDTGVESVLVPPLLLQPFCENAIWHGLMHKEGQGHLHITIKKDNAYLNCEIFDDGIGRQKSSELYSSTARKEKSMGLKITTERLSLFNGYKEVDSWFEMDDILNDNGIVEGTKVTIKIRQKDRMEALA
jgi:hypothetical protein